MHNEFSLPHEVFESNRFKGLRISSRILYCYLAKLKNRYANEEGWFWRSNETLSDEIGINIKTIKRAKRILKEKGFIETKRGYYVSTGHRAPDWYKLNGYAGY